MKTFIILFFLFPLFAHAQVIITVAGNGMQGYSGDGVAGIDAAINAPYGIALDDSNNLYICDGGINRRIRKVSPAYGGIITTIAGNGLLGYSGDGGPGIYAEVGGPFDVAIDHHGNVYFTDGGGGGCNCIRKITPADTITTIAGVFAPGYNGDNIAATTAQLNIPTGVTVDNKGNVYIADEYNHRIRKVDTAGIIFTIAGTGTAGFSPDGSRADTAKLDSLYGLKMDKAGNLYFMDNNRIRKMDTAGMITTVAGNGILGYSGDGGIATEAEISGSVSAIAIDSAGNLFIADGENFRIREISTAGIIHTIAGNGLTGFSGDGGNPLLAAIDVPEGIAISKSGDIYISDNGNRRIRVITKHPMEIKALSNQGAGINVYPNPSNGSFNFIVPSNEDEHFFAAITNVLGERIKGFSATTNQQVRVQLDVLPGIYFLSITGNKKYHQKIIIR